MNTTATDGETRAEAVRQKAIAVAGRNRADAVIRFTKKDLPDKLRPIGRLHLMEGVIVEVDKYYEAMKKAEGLIKPQDLATLRGNLKNIQTQLPEPPAKPAK